jgi:hypothetical protein
VRFSEIVTQYFRIGLSDLDRALVDASYLSVAHHRARSIEAAALGTVDGAAAAKFHSVMFATHVRFLFSVISRGDFSRAQDPTGEGLADRGAWLPPPDSILKRAACGELHAALACLPDPDFVSHFPPDKRFGIGKGFPFDLVLDAPDTVHVIRAMMLQTAA